MKSIDYIKQWLKENLSDKRYIHSLGCAETSKKLAEIFNEDAEKAYLAGLIHDCAKNFENDKLLDIINNKVNVDFNDTEIKNPKTFHAIAGTYIIQKKFEISNEDIIRAVRYHTIGAVDMTVLDKIIFLADKIEPNTRDEKNSKKLWKLIEKNKGIIGLDLAILKCFIETIKSLVKRKLYICPETINVYNHLIESVGILLEEQD